MNKHLPTKSNVIKLTKNRKKGRSMFEIKEHTPVLISRKKSKKNMTKRQINSLPENKIDTRKEL